MHTKDAIYKPILSFLDFIHARGRIPVLSVLSCPALLWPTSLHRSRLIVVVVSHDAGEPHSHVGEHLPRPGEHPLPIPIPMAGERETKHGQDHLLGLA